MSKSISIGIGVKIRVFILFLLGAMFVLPAIALVVTGFLEPDIAADDTLAMLFLGGLLGVCGVTIWWVMRKMLYNAKRRIKMYRDTDYMAMGMAHAHYIAGMEDTDSKVDTGAVESGADIDSGGSSGFDGDFGD